MTEAEEASLESMLEAVLKLLPPAWLHAEDTVARIRFRGREYATPGFAATGWMLTAKFGNAVDAGEIAVA